MDTTGPFTIHNNVIKKSTGVFLCLYFFIFLATFSSAQASTQNTNILILHNSSTVSLEITDDINSYLSKHQTDVKSNTLDSRSINEGFNASKYQLIISLGNHPAEYILKTKTQTPILSLLITNRAIEILKEKYKPADNWSSLSLNQPINRQLLLIKYLFPQNLPIGTIFEPTSRSDKNRLENAVKKMGLTLEQEHINDTIMLIPALKKLIEKCKILMARPDSIAFNKRTILGILLLTYRKGIPVIGFSKAYVDAGALAAVYSKPEQISKQSNELIKTLLTSGQLENNNIKPKYFSVALNENVARNLKLQLMPSDKLSHFIKQDESTK